ncbi:MAG: hypothetical protein NUW24_08975 [Anaerolineae bacterium]|jgi:hypothetical protein|nr:hypothetical protein [Anaerolineae bacterium]MDH7473191.1 hypothetical protein [Anaerolineae bacterium]
MANVETEPLFAPGKARWLLEGGLETLDAGERQMLLVMAEMAELQGRKLSAEEQEVITRLRTDTAGDYDAKDVAKKVKKLVKGKRKRGAEPFTLPPGLARLKEVGKK